MARGGRSERQVQRHRHDRRKRRLRLHDHRHRRPAEDGGGLDLFRIKIWDSATEAIVYDNMLGEADDSNAGTEITAGNIIVHDGRDALHAANGASLGIVGAMLDQTTLTPVVEQAMSYWAARGVGKEDLATLGQIDVRTADLAGSLLGVASSSNLIWVDRDAAGYGWDVDRARAEASPSGGMHLLSVVTHEFGHKLGFEHGDGHEVMGATLAPGVRTLITSASLPESLFTLWFRNDTLSSDTLRAQGPPAEKLQGLRVRDEFFDALALDADRSAASGSQLRDTVHEETARETGDELYGLLAGAAGQEDTERQATESVLTEDLLELLIPAL